MKSCSFPPFYTINFDNLTLTHLCNPLEHATVEGITDASEAAKPILLKQAIALLVPIEIMPPIIAGQKTTTAS